MNIKEGASFFPPFVLMLIATGGTSPALYKAPIPTTIFIRPHMGLATRRPRGGNEV